MVRINLKICTKCKKELPATSEYFGKKQTKDGLRYRCKECQKEIAKEDRRKCKQHNLKHSISREGTKKCSSCKRIKPKTEFYINRSLRDGLSSCCKKCKRIRQILFKFNINLEEYNTLLETQNYKCAICDRNRKELKRELDVDHDHETGKVRGLLCSRCNIKIEFYIKYKDIINNYLESN